jgi:ubiquinone/menaquinone biosynthesis C-methylase UbiE
VRKPRALTVGTAVLSLILFLGAQASNDELRRLSRVMGWKAGQTIGDVGAGRGEVGFAAAEVVGKTGRVYSTELDEEKREALENEVRSRGLGNVVVLQAAEKQTNLPDGCCDGIVLRRVYHHLTAPMEIDASLLRSLRARGELVVIDFPPRKYLSESDPVKGVPANRGGHGIPEKILIQELTAVGFRVDKVFDDWPEDSYCVVFRKPG